MKPTLFSLTVLTITLAAQPLLAEEMKAKPAGDAAPMMAVDTLTFLKMVTSANAFEIQSSELAKTNAEQPGIKTAADMIIADHKKAGEKLKATLQAKGDATEEPVKLAPKQQKMLDQLNGAKGKDFDMLYLDMQAQAHVEAVGLFRTYAGSGDDQSLIGFAKETLPALETHLSHVKMLIAEQ